MAVLNHTFKLSYEFEGCNMTNMPSLVECAKGTRFAYTLYQMQLLFAKELIMIPKYSFSPKDFKNPNSESALGSIYTGEVDLVADQTVLTVCNNFSLLDDIITMTIGNVW